MVMSLIWRSDEETRTHLLRRANLELGTMLTAEIGEIELRAFPDGETYLRGS
jgi:hypothetical protein